MSRLTRRPRGGTDRGAVAPLVAVLLASGVLLGMAAWVVDLGLTYVERDQVLNAAGAAALAGAEQCARFPPTSCVDPAALQANANANASDGQMSIDQTCVHIANAELPVCGSADGGAATHCLAPPLKDLNYVEVHTGTRTADGQTVLPPVFGTGSSGHVAGCARVAWGAPGGPYAAIGMSDCAFKFVYQRTGGLLGPPPQYQPAAAVVQVVPLEAPGAPGDDACDDAVFYDSANCWTGAAQGGTLTGRVLTGPGSTAPPGCEQLISAHTGTYVLMPIYSSYVREPAPDGAARFTIVGIAAFRITGAKLSDDAQTGGDAVDPQLPSDQFCGPGTTTATRCVRGYFVWANVIDGTTPAAGWVTTYGVAAYKTIG